MCVFVCDGNFYLNFLSLTVNQAHHGSPSLSRKRDGRIATQSTRTETRQPRLAHTDCAKDEQIGDLRKLYVKLILRFAELYWSVLRSTDS
jgi:hypothetical protein